jgi:hypothetical protein
MHGPLKASPEAVELVASHYFRRYVQLSRSVEWIADQLLLRGPLPAVCSITLQVSPTPTPRVEFRVQLTLDGPAFEFNLNDSSFHFPEKFSPRLHVTEDRTLSRVLLEVHDLEVSLRVRDMLSYVCSDELMDVLAPFLNSGAPTKRVRELRLELSNNPLTQFVNHKLKRYNDGLFELLTMEDDVGGSNFLDLFFYNAISVVF